MIIKSTSPTGVVTITVFLVYWLLGGYGLKANISPAIILAFLIISSYLFICWVVSVGKTIIMDEKGCTLKLWRYKKVYTWGELKEKYIEHCRGYVTEAPYSVTVIFSTQKLNKSKKCCQPTIICFSIHFHFHFSMFILKSKI